MKKTPKKLSRDIALEIGSILGKYFLKVDHLHYGYWTDDLPLDIANLAQAQRNYTQFLISHIPAGVKTVLDVGCGTGANAQKLLNLGYKVDCLTPSHFHSEKVSELLGDKTRVFECMYEEFQTQDRYDLILFSESFQYVPLPDVVTISLDLLNDDGYLLISDVFRKPRMKESKAIRGGHDLNKFHETIAKCPFQLIEDIDITDATAPNIDLLNDITMNVVKPILQILSDYGDEKYSFASKTLKWLYRKRIERKYNKYFTGGRTGQDFKNSRTYRLLLYKKTAAR